jgi:ribonuclease BN (tRNA processing enzyme)
VLTLTFLGVGSAFAKRNFQSNALVEAWSAGPARQASPDDTLLIDFGSTGPVALHQLRGQAGFSYLDDGGTIRYPAIRRVFVTHQHSDHIGGLEELAGMNMHCYGDRRPGPTSKPGLVASRNVLDNLWDQSLRGGLGALTGRTAALEDYFDTLGLGTADEGGTDRFSMLERYEFTVFPTDHIQIRQRFDWPSYGLLIKDVSTGETVVYSGDTRFDPEGLGPLMATARISFHEVQLEDEPDSVHARLCELRTLPETVRQRTLLYHYGDTWDDVQYASVADEFAGFAQPQHRYTLFD